MVAPLSLNLETKILFNVHLQSKLLYHTFVVDASSNLGQPFCPRQKNGGWVGRRVGYLATTSR